MAPLGVVLAGGRSSRMGQDKALLELDGQPLVERALALLRVCCGEVCIAGSRLDLARFAPMIADVHAGAGPLGGIEAAMIHAAGLGIEQVVFLPVDLPRMQAALLWLMLERSASTGALATLPTLLGRPQPLCSVLRTGLLPMVSATLDTGESKVMRVFERLGPGELDPFSVEAVAASRLDWPVEPPVHGWFENLNTPDDLASHQRTSPATSGSTTLVSG